MKIVGQDQPWTFPGPDGIVSVVGVAFDGDVAVIDNGALHSRGHLEAGIKFSQDDAGRGRGERVLYVWVTHPGHGVPERYHGACTAELWIDRPSKKGWKSPVDHVNRMTAAVRGTIDVAALSAEQKRGLAHLLEAYAPGAWEASPSLRQALVVPD
ncbi:MAG TPA: YwhD family protein [Planctomycetota bacterium]|nr:YwhD family protein [Planctomycetota bacterium]